ncbi:MAG: type II toxin-antitoxin system RelE/ParE family toxin, partial [Desulfococcaceae bacterium]
TKEFKRNLRFLSKKYRNVRSDIEPIIGEIQKRNFIGDQIPKTGNFVIYKVRVRNRDTKKGKSGGYRIIYFLETEEKVIFLTIYSKAEKSDISLEKIRSILKKSIH